MACSRPSALADVLTCGHAPTLRCLTLQGELYGDCVRVNSSSEECLVYGGGWGQCAALDQFAGSSSGKLTQQKP